MARRRSFAALALLLAAALAALGVWQIERRSWKLALIAQVEARLSAAPVDAPARARWPAIGTGDAYTRIRASGTWGAGAPVFVKAVTDLGGGFWMLQPIDTARGTILVNRGFVPGADRARVARATGAATVTGLLRISEPHGAFLRENDPAADRWFSRDVAAIARARRMGDVAPYFIDADEGGGEPWPRGGLTVVRFHNAHLVYALTWFALAGLAIFLAWRVAREPPGA